MLLLFLIRVTVLPPVWERAVHSGCRSCLREILSFCMYVSLPYGFEGDLIVLISLSLPICSLCISCYRKFSFCKDET